MQPKTRQDHQATSDWSKKKLSQYNLHCYDYEIHFQDCAECIEEISTAVDECLLKEDADNKNLVLCVEDVLGEYKRFKLS